MKKLTLLVVILCTLMSCHEKRTGEEVTLSGLKRTDFVSQIQGKPTDLYVLTNKNGVEACITNFGGRIVSLMVPDRSGKMTDVILGYGSIKDYSDNVNAKYGALIGRYGNRIADGKFTLNGQEYTLPQNSNGHCLHGGPDGYHSKVWDAGQFNSQTLELTCFSPDGEAGFPGNLNIKVVYTLTDDNAIDIKYEAVTDAPTVVNLTNHSFFNLSGKLDSPILDHTIMIYADQYTPIDERSIPTGVETVEGTFMDLRQPVVIGTNIAAGSDQLQKTQGYDHNWILNSQGDINILAAKATSPATGIGLEVYTNEPGLQFYTGNFMGGSKGKSGLVYPQWGGLCLEAQHYPDSPNQPDFPSTVLQPEEKYFSHCIYKFTID